MRLKSLELNGFKSFCQSTRIVFSPGITAIVGPNGCGKSNVVDAIRWVLGEQAPSRLRGKAAEDLIYAGNETNPPAGMAEVTMLLEAETGTNFPEPYSNLSEIAITRRIYRSSESEYLINRVPCRLKDITEFFMASQLHSRGYALVEQGKIEEIIQARPAEIRTMVEEAAGLALFKGRREISERKLERVRENLARIEDVGAELERQLNYARRQARKAETYRALRGELSLLEKLSAAQRIIEQRKILTDESSRERTLSENADHLRADIATIEAEVKGTATALASARHQLAVRKQELESLRAALEERARTRAFLQRRLETLEKQRPEIELRLAELETKAAAARAERASAGARLSRELRDDKGASEAQLHTVREQHRLRERKLRDEEKKTEDLKDQLAEVIREAASIKGRLGALAGERADLNDRLRSIEQTLPSYRIELDRCRQIVAENEARLEQYRSSAVLAEAALHETLDRELELRAEVANQARALVSAQESLRMLEKRPQRIVPNGTIEKLQIVLNSLNGEGPSDAPAMLLDVVKAPPVLEPALRAVLGEQLDAVIVDSPHFALKAIEILKESEGGRLAFIPDSLEASASHEPILADGIVGRLLDMVEIEPRYKVLAERLLGHVLVAKDLRAALEACQGDGEGQAFVTPEGDLLWPHRLISGGSGHHLEATDEIDLNKRERELETAACSVRLAEVQYEELVRAQDWARLACQDGLERLELTRQRVREYEAAAAQARAALGKAEQNVALSEADCAQAHRRMAELEMATLAANSRLEELAATEQQLRESLKLALETLTTWRNNVRESSEELHALGARIESRKAVIRALEQQLNHQRQLVEELEGQTAQYCADLERAARERDEFQNELAALTSQDTGAFEEVHKLENEIATLTSRCADHSRRFEAANVRLENARKTLENLEAELNCCQLKRESSRTLIEELTRSFHEKFESDFDGVAADLEAALRHRDTVKDAERLQELRAQAEKIGEVNLAAETEVKELEERAAKLQAERNDLRTAINDLSNTIQKLNREARKRFLETFEAAAKNFAELFPKLLRGGKGRLELSSAGDVLETGVNIWVQPPGKKIREIGLLSGGEKALSAMALIFALFLLNPSPFCVMDEVDAPLDEFNLAAFTGLLQELKSNAQFIVITHNQRTMQAADHIHGVTMERPGISRLISLKIPSAA
jgi:chromosome segregation protein